MSTSPTGPGGIQQVSAIPLEIYSCLNDVRRTHHALGGAQCDPCPNLSSCIPTYVEWRIYL